MPMKITVGLYLDGQRATEPANSLGIAMVGPLGLLSILETQLGLLAIRPSNAERIVQYRYRLAVVDAPARFYHATFRTDALGTAATLLMWRDLWYLHGWDGKFSASATGRLADLAAVEAANHALAPSVGERLLAISERMATRRLSIDQVTLLDPLEAFPKRWREVLDGLPLVRGETRPPSGDSFLSRLQDNLGRAVRGEFVETCPWRNDGSVKVVQAQTRIVAGAWVASQLRDGVPTTLLAANDGARMDMSLVSGGCPRHGLGESSPFRPVLQALPLALDILWEPLDFAALIQFLMNPICPVPRFARKRLAEKIADAPGIGGERWDVALDEIDQHYGHALAPGVRMTIQRWVGHRRFDHGAGAPLAAVQERIALLLEFFHVRMGDGDSAKRMAIQAGLAQCRSCQDALKELREQGVDTIRPRQLQRLVAQATANGSGNPTLVAEVGAHRAITHAGAAVEPVERVIWWQLGMPVMHTEYPWSSAECIALGAAGVDLPSSDVRLAQAAREWVRPVLAARRHLSLVLPPAGEEVHPLWQMIEAITGKPDVIVLEDLLASPSLAMQPVGHTPLPAPKRWWRLPDELAVTRGEAASYTSLELMLFNPYHWLLKYPARLRPSRFVTLGGDFRLFGNLAHRMVELMYREPGALSMTHDAFSSWFEVVFPRLVSQEGASLLAAGRGADLAAFRHRLRESVRALREQVSLAGIVRVAPELTMDGSFAGGRLVGVADLVMESANGEQAILDMKWAGVRKFAERLKMNRHLQLAIYAEMWRQKQGRWPSVAYFVLNRARLFAADGRMFPGGEVIASDSGENTPELYQRFLETWAWRADQIAEGCFEVVIGSTEPDDDSVPPVSAMMTETLNEAYNEYRSLAGWEA